MPIFGNRAPGMMPNPNQMAMRRDISMLRQPMPDSRVQSPYGGKVYTGTVVNPNSGQGMGAPGMGASPPPPSSAGSGPSPMPPLPNGMPPAWGQNGMPPGMGMRGGFGQGPFGGLFRRLMQNPQMQQQFGQWRGVLGPMLQQFRNRFPQGGQ